jgi:patatin-like phospholipase/acyl hydrolase
MPNTTPGSGLRRQANHRPIKILSIDGGGYRGIATLHMLRHLLQQIEGSENGNRKYYPYKHFDLICGTSTGGLIALMLGRLGMDVDAAIAKYRELGPIVFGKDEGVFKLILRGRRFDTRPFKTALKSWLGSQELRVEDGELNDLCHVS